MGSIVYVGLILGSLMFGMIFNNFNGKLIILSSMILFLTTLFAFTD